MQQELHITSWLYMYNLYGTICHCVNKYKKCFSLDNVSLMKNNVNMKQLNLQINMIYGCLECEDEVECVCDVQAERFISHSDCFLSHCLSLVDTAYCYLCDDLDKCLKSSLWCLPHCPALFCHIQPYLALFCHIQPYLALFCHIRLLAYSRLAPCKIENKLDDI